MYTMYGRASVLCRCRKMGVPVSGKVGSYGAVLPRLRLTASLLLSFFWLPVFLVSNYWAPLPCKQRMKIKNKTQKQKTVKAQEKCSNPVPPQSLQTPSHQPMTSSPFTLNTQVHANLRHTTLHTFTSQAILLFVQEGQEGGRELVQAGMLLPVRPCSSLKLQQQSL